MNDETKERRVPPADDEEGPPFGGSWRTLYVLLLAWLAAQVVLSYLFTRAFE